CDTTTVEFVLHEINGPGVWNLTADLVDDPFKGNPHPDRYGHPDVWRFSDMADTKRGVRPQGAFADALAIWRRSPLCARDHTEVERASQTFAQQVTQPDSHNPFWPATPEEAKLLPPAAQQAITQAESELALLKQNMPPPVAFCNGVQEGGIPECPQA